jgi:L-arabinose isomerase
VQDIDFLLVYVTTYAPSSTVPPVVARTGVPVMLLNLHKVAGLLGLPAVEIP